MKAFLHFFLINLLSIIAAYSQLEPNAGKWKTFVIPAGNEINLPPPPNAKATKEELKALLVLQAQRNDAAIKNMNYWNAGAPGYRWNQISKSLANSGVPPFRLLALVNVAIYDATIAAWHNKYTYNRNRTTKETSALQPLIPNPESPSYPCERAVAAGAAATVLAYLFPAKADSMFT